MDRLPFPEAVRHLWVERVSKGFPEAVTRSRKVRLFRELRRPPAMRSMLLKTRNLTFTRNSRGSARIPEATIVQYGAILEADF